MVLKQIIKIIRGIFQKEPPYLIFFITARCNSRCKTCFYWQKLNKEVNELSLKEISKISKNFKQLLQLSLTGGEPFLRKDLVEICKIFAKNNDPFLITIPTNGLMPDRIANTTEKILKSCPNSYFRISLSLDGVGKLHDEIRGADGNFEKVKETIDKLNELKKTFKNFNIDIGTVLSSYNQRQIKEIFDYVDKNMKVDNHLMGLARGNTRKKEAKNVLIENYEEMTNYFNKKSLKDKKPLSKIYDALFRINMENVLKILKYNKPVIPCLAGKKLIEIGENGDVFPCELLEKIGNIRDYNYNINKLFSDREVGKKIKAIQKDKCFCRFECAMNVSIIFNYKYYPRLLWKALTRIFDQTLLQLLKTTH
jgi:MoaA/NifB/PqqE/SkfB family radical SAM enzyme